MTEQSPPRSRTRPSERSLVETAAAHLASQGYRTYVDPDRSSYFDLAAVRGAEVGLVEAKVGKPREVLLQALKRRAWADWVAVVIDSERAAQRLIERTDGQRAAGIGVWVARGTALRELRTARPRAPAEPDPFAELRARLRAALDAIERGETPAGVGWSGVPSEVRRASGGRGFGEWRLEELVD